MKLSSRRLNNIYFKAMSFIEFKHKGYGQMITAPEYWVEYNLFDATDKLGDTWPVYKDDCKNAEYIEE